ncbi:MAG: Rrf2 family transcriptional regulator [Candidatus Omnitrophica bacterium]|nr:Rrf2 family transcriptional regulator [Candidatus Omnitrophota bacterium]
MKFSQSVDLAIHSLVYIAHNSTGEPVIIRELARSVRASESYLARIMLQLVKVGFVNSIRGKHGGFVFRKSPEQITIADVVMAIDQDAAQFVCPWEERGCEVHENECPLRSLFCKAQQQMFNVLRTMTISDIAADHVREHRRVWLNPIDSTVANAANKKK